MKPFDLYQHFHNFCEMLDNEALELKTRLDMGRDWIRSLPAPMLCAPYELSRTLIEEAMKGRLQEKCKEYGQRIRETSEEAEDGKGQVEVSVKAEPRPKPLRANAGDGRGKTSVEDLDRPKVSKTKR